MEDNPRQELYERFRKSLTKPIAERFFDEDELVELYDYAGDLNDDYVQMEALFCGARLYPESVALAERRALLYMDTTVDDGVPSPAAGAYAEDAGVSGSLLFDIVRLQSSRPDDPVAALEFLLNQYDGFSDEEAIRFLDLAFDLDQYSWVLERLPELRKRVKYQPVIVYELMREAEERADDEATIRFAEELIESEPFVPAYWLTLFRAQARSERTEAARSTFDYARALAADADDVLLGLAEGVYLYAPYLYKEAIELLDSLIEAHPEEFGYVDCRCALYARMGSAAMAVSSLKSYLDRNPTDGRALRQLLACNARDLELYVARYFDQMPPGVVTAEALEETMTMLSVNGSSRAILALAENLPDDVDMTVPMFCAVVEANFATWHYRRVIDMVDSYDHLDQVLDATLKGVAVCYSYEVAAMKLGLGEKAVALAARVRPMMEEVMTVAPMPVRMAVRSLATLHDKIRRHPVSEQLYWEYFDMLPYGKFR